MAYAGALFADSCLRGLNGDSNVFDYSYVESDITDVPFFSSRVDLGPEGETLPCYQEDCQQDPLARCFIDQQARKSFMAQTLMFSLPMHYCSPTIYLNLHIMYAPRR